MKKSLTLIMLCVLICSCVPKQMRDHDYYFKFLNFAESWIGYIQAANACDDHSAEEKRLWLEQRREHFVLESKDANWKERTLYLRTVLWIWLGQQRDGNEMDQVQWEYFAEMLATWQ